MDNRKIPLLTVNLSSPWNISQALTDCITTDVMLRNSHAASSLPPDLGTNQHNRKMSLFTAGVEKVDLVHTMQDSILDWAKGPSLSVRQM